MGMYPLEKRNIPKPRETLFFAVDICSSQLKCLSTIIPKVLHVFYNGNILLAHQERGLCDFIVTFCCQLKDAIPCTTPWAGKESEPLQSNPAQGLEAYKQSICFTAGSRLFHRSTPRHESDVFPLVVLKKVGHVKSVSEFIHTVKVGLLSSLVHSENRFRKITLLASS